MNGRDTAFVKQTGLAVLGLEEDGVSVIADHDASHAFAIDVHDFYRIRGLDKPVEDLTLKPVTLWFLRC